MLKKSIKQFLFLLAVMISTLVIGTALKEYYGWQSAIYISGWIGGSLFTSFKVFIV